MPLVLAFRYPLAALRARRMPSASLLDETRLDLRVRPSDCDVYLHVNNGRYLSLMDIGRISHAQRCGMVDAFRGERWKPVAGGATIRFRRELRMFRRYALFTRCAGWDDGWTYFEQRFQRADGALAARAVAKVAVLDRDGRRLDPHVVVDRLGLDTTSPPLCDDIVAWRATSIG